MNAYPIFLTNLAGRRCVVVGGGAEAERKARGLMDAGARVVVIAPDITDGLREWADSGRIEWLARGYESGDLAGALLAIASEPGAAINAEIFADANAAGVLLNTLDEGERCTFIAGSTVTHGPLTIAISTNGTSPAFAVRMREWLENRLPGGVAAFLETAVEIRASVAEKLTDAAARREFWFSVVDSDVPDLFDAGEHAAARAKLAAMVARASEAHSAASSAFGP